MIYFSEMNSEKLEVFNRHHLEVGLEYIMIKKYMHFHCSPDLRLIQNYGGPANSYLPFSLFM